MGEFFFSGTCFVLLEKITVYENGRARPTLPYQISLFRGKVATAVRVRARVCVCMCANVAEIETSIFQPAQLQLSPTFHFAGHAKVSRCGCGCRLALQGQA